MGFLTHEQKARIIRLRSNGKGVSKIVRILVEDNIKSSRWSIIRFLRWYQERQSLENAPKFWHPSQGVTTELMNLIDTEMERNDELTSPELARRILLHFGWQFSQEKVWHLRWKLGWVKQAPNTASLFASPTESNGWSLGRSVFEKTKSSRM